MPSPTARCVVLLASLALAGPLSASAGDKPLRLRVAELEPRALGAAPDSGGAWVIQAERAAVGLLPALAALDCRVLGYLPEDAYLVRCPRPAALLALPGARWAGPWRPAWKLDPRLAAAGGPCELRLLAHAGESLEPARAALAAEGRLLRLGRSAAGTGHAELALDEATAERLARLAALPEVAWIGPRPRVELSNDDAAWVVQGGEFASASTPLFAGGLTGLGQVIAVADSGLDTDACQFRLSADPAAQTLANTTQPPAALVTDPDRKVLTYYLLDGATAYDDRSKLGHGTHVAGCAAGDDHAHLCGPGDPGRDRHDGMAPCARLVIQDMGRRDGQQAGMPGSLTDLLVQAHASGARVHNHSYGLTDPDTGYSAEASEVDEGAWRLPELLVVWSAGNLGPAGGSLAGLGATAKSPLVVGGSLAGVSNQGRGVCAFSSQGPAADGRLKPDLVAPGAVRSALETDWVARGGTDIYGQPTADSTTDPPNSNCAVDESFRVGTSFAAPLVAGAAALARQYFTAGYYPDGLPAPGRAVSPSAALLKALLLSAAESIVGPLYDTSSGERLADLAAAPTPVQGWGLLRLDRSLPFPGDAERLLVLCDSFGDGQDRGLASRAPLEHGQAHAFGLRGVRAGSLLRVVLAWTDPAAAPGAGRALVNDLDLEVEDSAGVLYRGNVGLAANRSTPAGASGPDALNTAELVLLANPIEQDLVVRVRGRSVPGNGRTSPYPSTRQGYALLAVGELDGACLDGPCGAVDGGAGDGGEDGEDGAGDGEDGAGPDGAEDAEEGGGDGDPEDGGGEQVSLQGGCGCGPGAAAMGWPALLALGLGLRRWRRRGGRP